MLPPSSEKMIWKLLKEVQVSPVETLLSKTRIPIGAVLNLRNQFRNDLGREPNKKLEIAHELNLNQGVYSHSNGCHCSFVYYTSLCTGKYMS